MASNNNGVQKRYDRQIRLWGAHGQARLEASKICVLGAGPMCTEALKNLVLGGIASFTIVDSKNVAEEDLRNNFFFQPSSLGSGRAQAACTLLRDLNDQVKGSFSDADVADMLDSSPDALNEYNLVIADQMPSKLIVKLDSKCRRTGAYLIVLRSQGPFASIQISGPELCIIETKPDTVPADLRLSTAWPELLALADNIDLLNCDDITHKHTPWGATSFLYAIAIHTSSNLHQVRIHNDGDTAAVLLIKAIAAWKAEHGDPPSSSAERRAFKQVIQGWRHTIDGIPVEEENFEEAVRHAHTAFTELKVPEHVKALMDDEKCTNLTASSSDFWIALAALKRFVETEGEGTLPLEGTIPDMTATTELYLQLQRVYRARADSQIESVQAQCKALLKSVGKAEDGISLDYIKLLCKNARHVRVVRPPAAVRKPSEMNSECLRKSFESEEQMHEAMILLAILAADTFYEQHQRAPGETATPEDASWELDIPIMQQIVSQLASELRLPAGVVKQDLLLEFCRAAGSPMHTISAIVGGIAAQEGLKVLLQQFVPLDGIFVYNGIHAASAVLPL